MTNIIDEYVGINLKLWRMSKEMDRCDVSKTLSVSEERLELWETGRLRISADEMLLVCTQLGIRPSELYAGICSVEEKA